MYTRFRPFLALALALTLPACAKGAASAPAEVKLETDDQKVLYSIGLFFAQNLTQFDLTADELTLVQAGLADGALGKEPKVNLQEMNAKMQAFAQARITARAEKEKTASAEFLAQEAGKAGATKAESGMIYSEITAGTGESPKATDTVTVHYKGTLRDGSVFDSSVERGQPATFPLNGVIPCWTEGVQKIKVGGKSRLICPSAIAYGDQGRPPKIPGGAVLIFEVELISIAAPAAPPAAPPAQ